MAEEKTTATYKNGQLKYEINHKNGKLHGLRRWWDTNGQLIQESNYKNGKTIRKK